MKKFKQMLSVSLAVLTVILCATFIGAANISFTDVSGHWAWTNGQIPYLVEKNVLNGYKNQSNGTYSFKPDGEVTRAEFIKMLDETFGLTATVSINFNDIKTTDWYYPYYAKAAAQGYILNYGSNGSPNSKITRQEATALLVRYLDLPAGEKASSNSIADYSDISDNFKDYVLRAVKANIINGYSENGKTYFKPKKTLTRAEALTILYRAAGCIYNESAYSRDSGAPSSNNSVTRGGISIHNVTFDGRNIITEGASSDKITFSGCTINGTLYIRGSADVTFDNCKVENIVSLGGGKITLVSGSEVENLTLETASDISILSNTTLDTLEVKNGCDNVSVNGGGKLKKAYINADKFSSSMMPEEFEIGNNLSASFSGTMFSGSSETQNAFAIDPFVTRDKDYYYLNIAPAADGIVYYYYTDSATAPSVSGFESNYMRADKASSFDVSNGKSVTEQTYSASEVEDYDYVVIQFQDGSRKYGAVVISNTNTSSETGFSTEPYLKDSTTVKYKTSISGDVMWFYAEDGTKLSQLEFLTAYEKQTSALKGETSVNTLNTFTVTLKQAYLKNYDYVAFMLKGATGTYYVPVILSIGDNGFTDVPTVKTAGKISFKPSVSGDLYYYYSENENLPTASDFKSEYNAANYSDKTEISRDVSGEIKYDTDYIDDYPYMILSIRNSDGEYMQPVSVNIDLTTGFAVEPKVKDASTISFKTEDYGTVYYYYTKEKTAPSISAFDENYDDAQNKYKGKVECGKSYEYIEYKGSYAETYPYMAIMFVDEEDEKYSPVLVELDAVSDTGFVRAPYAQNGKVYFSTEEDGEVLYFYSRDDENVDPDDFYEWYQDAGRYDGNKLYGTVDTTEKELTYFEITEEVLERYPYIILAFNADDDDDDEFYFPYVLDVEQSEMSQAGSGLEVGDPDEDGEVKVKALYDGKLYYYLTNKESELPSATKSFESKYENASNSDYESVDADERVYLDMDDYDYLVICLKVGSDYLSYVVVDAENGASDGGSFDDGHDKSGYGIDTPILYNDKGTKAYVTPEHDGTLTLLIVENGKIQKSEFECEEGEESIVSLPGWFEIMGDIISGDVEFYVQLTDKNGNKYEAYKLDFFVK